MAHEDAEGALPVHVGRRYRLRPKRLEEKIGRSDERVYHAAESPVRRPAPREAAFTAETPLPAGGKKKYYN